MVKSDNRTINSLPTHDDGSVGSDSFLNTLRQDFDHNYKLWCECVPGDPQRKILRDENEKLLGLILEGR